MAHLPSNKGQLFSLDFLIAMGLAVLAIGMLLNYYETTTNAEKEQRLQNELTAVALNASALMMQINGCDLGGGFQDTGYTVYGCSSQTNAENLTRSELMVPKGFKCKISWTLNGVSGEQDDPATECADDDSQIQANVASVERVLLSSQSPLSKADYQKGIEQGIGAYYDYILTVKVWK